MEFKKYHKIYRLGKEETDGILKGTCHVQEKIDGANTSIWLKDGVVQCGSRNRHLTNEEFGGFVPYAQGHEGIQKLLNRYPTFRLYGEWLVKHTVIYNETAYKKFYLFDILGEEGDRFLSTAEVNALADIFKIDKPKTFDTLHHPTVEQLEELVGQSEIGENGEGIVIKNFEFINVFGDRVYAKMVRQKFMEENAITFGGNNKHADCYWEMYIVNKWITLARVQKVMNKIAPEINERFDMKHIPRIVNTCYHDMVTEEAWEIAKKAKKVDFNILKRIASKKAKLIYVDILNEQVREINNK